MSERADAATLEAQAWDDFAQRLKASGYTSQAKCAERTAMWVRARASDLRKAGGCKHDFWECQDAEPTSPHYLKCRKCGATKPMEDHGESRGARGDEAGQRGEAVRPTGDGLRAADLVAPQDGASPQATVGLPLREWTKEAPAPSPIAGGVQANVAALGQLLEKMQLDGNYVWYPSEKSGLTIEQAAQEIATVALAFVPFHTAEPMANIGIAGITAVPDKWLYNVKGILLGMNTPSSVDLLEELNRFTRPPSRPATTGG